MTLTKLAGSLLLGTALALATLPAIAQDAAAPAAPATAAPAAPATAAPADAAPAAPAAPAPEVTPDTVVATVGDQTITEADLSFAAEDLQQELQQMQPDQQRAFLVTVLIDMKIMAAEAKRDGMDQTDIFKKRLQYLTERALRRAYFADKIATGVTADAISAAYQKVVAAFKPEEEIHARHILVATKEEADQVEADLKGGKPFEMEAMAKTIDPSGKSNGGDLGYFTREQMVKEFADAAFALDVGQVSEPVQSQFGWHVIKVEDKRQSSPPPMDQLAQQLSQQVMYEGFDKAIAQLKQGVAVNIPDAALAAQVQQQTETEGAAESPDTN